MNRIRRVELTADRSGERLDVFISRRCPDLSRSHARRLIDEGQVAVNGRLGKPSEQVAQSTEITINIPPSERLELLAEPIQLTIIYQDGDIIVVDKPAGLTVHPAP